MDIINLIVDGSKKESDLDSLKKMLDQNLDKIKSNANHFTTALNNLDSEKHTLGLIYLLFAKATHAPKVDPSFLMNTERLLININKKQAQRCADKYAFIVHRYMEAMRDSNNIQRAISTIHQGIETFSPSAEHLTPLHADYLCLCLKGKLYRAGERLLERKIFDIEPNLTGVTPRDMLLYYYYGGLIYAGLKKFEQALRFFDTALCVPSFALSAIMVESFKKYVLISLLVHGKFLGINKNASNIVHRHMKTYCSIYVDLANAYANNDVTKVLQNLNDNLQEYQKDQNHGLVKQCLNALKRRNIQRLTETFMTLSLSDIAKEAKLSNAKEAEEELLKMIANGEINAVINQKDGMVSFEEETKSFTSQQASHSLEDGLNRSIQLAQRLKTMDEQISLSQSYIARIHGIREDLLGTTTTGGEPSMERGMDRSMMSMLMMGMGMGGSSSRVGGPTGKSRHDSAFR